MYSSRAAGNARGGRDGVGGGCTASCAAPVRLPWPPWRASVVRRGATAVPGEHGGGATRIEGQVRGRPRGEGGRNEGGCGFTASAREWRDSAAPAPPAPTHQGAHRGTRTRRLRRGRRPGAPQRRRGRGGARQTAGRAGCRSPPGRPQSPPAPHARTTTTRGPLPPEPPASPAPPVALPHYQPPPLGLINVGAGTRTFFGLALRAPVCARTTSIKPSWKRICRGGRPRWGAAGHPP